MRHWRLVVAWALITSGATALAAEATDSLAALVGQDAAVFVDVRGLDRRWEELKDSKVGRRWQSSGLHRWFWSVQIDPIQKWQALDAHVSAATGASFSEQLRALFGEEVGLALYLPPQGEPQGVLIAKASSSAAVDRVLQSWEKLEPPLRNERRMTARGSYFRRVFRREGSERSLFYARHEQMFVLSDHEHLVRDCVERGLDQPSRTDQPTLATSPEFRDLRARFPEDAWAVAFLNPRQWDRVLERDADKSAPSQRVFAAWKTFRSVGAAVSTTDGVRAELIVRLDEGRTGSQWRAFAAAAPAPPMLAEAPSRAVAVIGARMRCDWLIARWQELLSPQDREGLDKGRRVLRGLLLDRDAFDQVAPQVFEDWGIAIEAHGKPGSEARWWDAWDVTATAFSISPEVRESLDNALTFGLNALATDRNGKTDSSPPWYLEKTGSRRVLHGLPNIQPAYQWIAQRFVAASRAELLDRAMDSGNPAIKTTAARHFSDARLFAWLDLQRLSESDPPKDALPFSQILRPLARFADQGYLSVSWSEAEVRFRTGLTVEAVK